MPEPLVFMLYFHLNIHLKQFNFYLYKTRFLLNSQCDGTKESV